MYLVANNPSVDKWSLARRRVLLYLHVKALLPRSFEINFLSITWGTCASTPRTWCARLFAKPRGISLPSGVKSKIGFNTGNGSLSSSLWLGQGNRILVSPFRERPPRCPRSTDAALCGWCQNGNSADTEHEPSHFFCCRMGLVEEMGPTDQPC